ncbi:hypothetical protein D3C85_1765040 [compost metagenome]
MPQGQWLMEVKAEKTIPVWLAKMLSEHRMYRTSFSKYGNEYKKMLKASKIERESALYA